VPASGGEDLWTRSPEETRSTMTAIQQGWERGRSVFDVPLASPPAEAEAIATPEHGAGTEGGTDARSGPETGAATAPEAGPATEDGGLSV
jgi:hypothetical protein